jgi:hypothetical protein
MKKVFWVAMVLFFILIVVAYFTKTSKQEFTSLATSEWEKYNDKMSSDPVMEDVMAVQNEFMTKAIDKLVRCDDYFFFSKFTLQLADGDYQYIGLFHQVIPLQNANPLKQFYEQDPQ